MSYTFFYKSHLPSTTNAISLKCDIPSKNVISRKNVIFLLLQISYPFYVESHVPKNAISLLSWV